jgi:hypothetical protein
VFWRHYWDCAPCSYPDRSGDLLTVTTIADFYTRRQFHNTGMYADYLGPAGVEAEAMVCLSAPARRVRRLLFFRGPGPGFDGRDRLLLSLLRPHLNECYQELARRQAAPALTPGSWNCSACSPPATATPKSPASSSCRSAPCESTRKNIFTRLGVTNAPPPSPRPSPARPTDAPAYVCRAGGNDDQDAGTTGPSTCGHHIGNQPRPTRRSGRSAAPPHAKPGLSTTANNRSVSPPADPGDHPG